jgi:hypothetical protein
VRRRRRCYSGEQFDRWYGGSGFLTALPVVLPASGTKSVTMSF